MAVRIGVGAGGEAVGETLLVGAGNVVVDSGIIPENDPVEAVFVLHTVVNLTNLER